MRVAYIANCSVLYGANRSLLNLLDGLMPLGVEPCVLAPSEGPLLPELCRRGIPYAVVPFEWWMHPTRNIVRSIHRGLLNCDALSPTARHLERWGVDLVHTNASVVPVGWMAARWLRLPHVWHIREFDCAFHYDWGRNLFRRVVGSSEAVIAISRAIRNYVLPPANPRAVVIPDGIFSEREFSQLGQSALQRRPPYTPFTFAIVGLVHPAKGQDVAIAALAQVAAAGRDARLLIVGSGEPDYLTACKSLARDLGVEDRVEFWGYREDPFEALFASHAALVCSRSEGLGRVTVEAMAACRPVIGYNSSGTAEIIQHESTGLLYSGGAEELAQQMLRLIDNPEYGWRLGAAGWEDARKRFSVERCASQVYEVYQNVLAGRSIGSCQPCHNP